MKTVKSRVFLVELILVILFFALSTAAVLQLFMAANRQSERSELRTQALVEAQNMAERLRNTERPQTVLDKEGWSAVASGPSTCYTRRYDRAFQPSGEGEIVLSVTVEQQNSEGGGTLLKMKVSVEDTADNGGRTLCSLDADRYLPGWKEGAR